MSLMNFKVTGTHCKSCKILIEDIMEDLDTEVVSLDLDEQAQVAKLQVKSDKSADEIKKAIEAEGEYIVTEE